jgi:hypothetical protein
MKEALALARPRHEQTEHVSLETLIIRRRVNARLEPKVPWMGGVVRAV